MPNDATVSYEEDLDHILIWLDVTIGETDSYVHLKDAFSSSSDPKHETPVKLIDRDYDELLRIESPKRVNFEGVWFLLAAFTEIEPCLRCFEANRDKRIFFIVSGSLGRTVVPMIFARFPRVFDDPQTRTPYNSIYVYCHNIDYQMDWAMDYYEYIQIFNHDADLLVRMIRDMGGYFVMIAKRSSDGDPPNNEAAYHQLKWAHELYQRYVKMQSVSLTKELEEINELMTDAEDAIKLASDEDN